MRRHKIYANYLAGYSSLVLGLLGGLFLLHLLYVVVSLYTNNDNYREYAHAEALVRDVCPKVHDYGNRLQTECDRAHAWIQKIDWKVFQFHWGYWRQILIQTFNEHCEHIKSLFTLVPMSLLVSYLVADPVSMLAAAVSVLTFITNVLAFMGTHCLRRGQRLQEEERRAFQLSCSDAAHCSTSVPIDEPKLYGGTIMRTKKQRPTLNEAFRLLRGAQQTKE